MQIRHLVSVLALIASAIGPLAAQAQARAPGLWESSVSFKSMGGEMEQKMAEMQKKLESMPPEQRRQVEAMMSSHNMTIGPAGTTVKVCVTPEEAARDWQPHISDRCTQEITQRTANSMKIKFRCTQPPSSGEGEVSFIGDKAYTGKMAAMYDMKGKPQQMNIDMSGKWLSADCGSVKPRASAKP